MKLVGRPDPGTLWLFSHNRFRFAGGKPDHTTTSPGGTYQKIDFFTYLYFTDGREPCTEVVLDAVERRAKPPWGMELCGKTYLRDEDGLREISCTITSVREKETARRAEREEKAKATLERVLSGGPAEPLALSQAGKYDFNRPSEYDGFNGFYRHNPDVEACRARDSDRRLVWKTDGSFRPRVLFVTGFGHQLRDAVETSLRFPMDAGWYPGNFGASGPYDIGVSLGTAADKERQFESLLARNPEIIVFDGFHLGFMPVVYKAEVLRRVRDEGLSLVFLTNGAQFNDVFARCRAGKAVAKGERVFHLGRGTIIDATARAAPEPWSPDWRERYERRHVLVWNLMRRARGLEPDAEMERRAEGLVRAAADFGGMSFVGGDVVPEGSLLPVAVSFATPAPAGAELSVEVASMPYGETWRSYRQCVPEGATSAAFTLGDGEFPTLAGLVDAKLASKDGTVLARARKPFHYPNRRFPDYTLVSWDGCGYGKMSGAASAFMAPLLVDDLGYGSALGAVDGSCTLFNTRPVPYRCRVNLNKASNGGVTWPQIAGFARQNPVLRAAADRLGEETNPYDPAVRAMVEAYFTKEVERVVPYGVSLWDLGDECAVVYDAGHGPQDARPYAEFLKSKYGSVAEFNKIRGTSIRDFSEAPHLGVQEALARRDYAAWLDHIEYMDRMYADAFQMFASIIRRYDPKARIGAEGSVPGDLELTVKGLDFWGPYRNLVADETLRNLRPDAVRGIWWGGYIQCMRSGFPLEQWEYVMTGTVNADLWFQMDPGQTLSGFGGDLELAPYVSKMLPYLKKLRRGVAQILIKTPFRNDGFAAYRSQLSLRAGQVGGGFRSPDVSIGAMIRHCYRTGRDVRILATTTLDGIKDVKVLLLTGATALRDDEIAAFKAFSKRGGVILADCEPGVLNRYLLPRAEPPLKGLWRPMADPDDDIAFSRCLAEHGIGANRESLSGLDPSDAVFRVREAPDFRIVGFKASPKSLGRKVEIALGGKAFVYEADGTYVGEADMISIPSLDVPFKVYSVFEKMQEKPVFSWKDGVLETGALRRGSVYRAELRGPDGAALPHRELVFVADGRAVSFPFALSDRTGVWNVDLCDVATGLKSTVEVRRP